MSTNLPEWFDRQGSHPDFVDSACDDLEMVLGWKCQYIDMLKKLVKELVARPPEPGEGEEGAGPMADRETVARLLAENQHAFRYVGRWEDWSEDVRAHFYAVADKVRALAAGPRPSSSQPLPLDPEALFNAAFYAGAESQGWSDGASAGCDLHIGQARTEAWEKLGPKFLAPSPESLGDK